MLDYVQHKTKVDAHVEGFSRLSKVAWFLRDERNPVSPDSISSKQQSDSRTSSKSDPY
jgi:hypothetical protein